MKKIINGKIYDTNTATCVATYSNGGGFGDFSHLEERLYRKKTGEYFIHGEGGPMTKYAHPTGQNNWSGGERITPMTFDAAKAWAEEYADPDDYAAAFGAVSDDVGTVVLSVSMPEATAGKLRRCAQASGMTVSGYIASLVENETSGNG